MIPIITIDGPSGAGKGTVSKLIAEKTEFHLLDSGAIYRLAALASLDAAIDLEDERAVEAVAKAMDIRFDVTPDGVLAMLAGKNVTSAIRSEKVGMAASKIAAYTSVRAALLQQQRDFCQRPGLVADGRDMGTVVFPDAPIKIFLTASAEERAKRRVLQLESSGVETDYQKILQDIEARDHADSTRKTAPLKPADDALVLDSTQLSIDEVLHEVMHTYKEKFSS